MTLFRNVPRLHLVPSKRNVFHDWIESEYGVDVYDVVRLVSFDRTRKIDKISVERTTSETPYPVVCRDEIAFLPNKVYDLRHGTCLYQTGVDPDRCFANDRYFVKMEVDPDLSIWILVVERGGNGRILRFDVERAHWAYVFNLTMQFVTWRDLRTVGDGDFLMRYVCEIADQQRRLLSIRLTRADDSRWNCRYDDVHLRPWRKGAIFVGRENDRVFEIFDGELIATYPDGKTRRRPFVLRDGETAKTTEIGDVVVDDGKSIKYYDVDVDVAEKANALHVPEAVKRDVFRRVAFDENYSYDFS